MFLTVIDNKEMRNSCRPFTKMIPAILNGMIPTAVRKKSDKQFIAQRLKSKSVPRNDNPGDCGLSDEIIQDVRRKLAAQIYDVVGEPQITDLFPAPPK
ncbi:unnamed protein product [Eruca vesicaria subsp. sativa]|uniref:Ubiquitin-like protease family profile domain-containing protein n=1 Tax=Eruca vesicaria subsp. sativa TaxID=29727 RepID=A0ABC8JW44_ERUVS|nr:unnamed protein product [Eruca vesicaria subsp. sativa]